MGSSYAKEGFVCERRKKVGCITIGGASGTGKTIIGKALSRYFNVDLVRVDDFQIILETMTTEECLPPIHYWKKHPDWQNEGVEAAVNQLLAVGRVFMPGLMAVINDHIDENIPMILEGDFILPELSASINNPRVKSIFIYEPSKEQILHNYLERDGIEQQYRAEVSHSYGNWLSKSCSELSINVVYARPWGDLLERIAECLNNKDNSRRRKRQPK
jgi:2-phosphoglycerate kinase